MTDLRNRLSAETHSHQLDVNLLIVCLGDLTRMLTNQDPIHHMRALVRQWEESIPGRALEERIVQGGRAIDQLRGQRARRRSGKLWLGFLRLIRA